jgi:hypothetical protein
MTQCEQNPDAAERYTSGDMAEPERVVFEDHFFGCSVCFRTVQALQDAAGLLEEDSRTPGAPHTQTTRCLPYKWLAMAAMLTVAVVIWNTTEDERQDAVVPATSIAPATEPRPTAAPVPPPAAPANAPSDVARSDVSSTLDRWASVSPPQFVPLPTRSAQDTSDPQIQPFNEAMAHYSAGRYHQAADGLGALAEHSPDAAHVHFFLGISELMSNNVSRARGALQRSANSGVSPYADEAHFYLAKAALKAGDLTSATRELQIAVEREAGPDGDAARLLAEVRNALK